MEVDDSGIRTQDLSIYVNQAGAVTKLSVQHVHPTHNQATPS